MDVCPPDRVDRFEFQIGWLLLGDRSLRWASGDLECGPDRVFERWRLGDDPPHWVLATPPLATDTATGKDIYGVTDQPLPPPTHP